MYIRIGVDAAILHHNQAVVSVAGVKQRGEHDAAGGNAEQHERVDLLRAQNHLEVGSVERIDAVLRNDYLVVNGCDVWMNRACRALKHLLP